jgi:hypothetical protein
VAFPACILNPGGVRFSTRTCGKIAIFTLKLFIQFSSLDDLYLYDKTKSMLYESLYVETKDLKITYRRVAPLSLGSVRRIN